MRKTTVRSPRCERIAVPASSGTLRGAVGIIGERAFELWTDGGERRYLPGPALREARCLEHGVPYALCRPLAG